jgi:hypothetical protein
MTEEQIRRLGSLLETFLQIEGIDNKTLLRFMMSTIVDSLIVNDYTIEKFDLYLENWRKVFLEQLEIRKSYETKENT